MGVMGYGVNLELTVYDLGWKINKHLIIISC